MVNPNSVSDTRNRNETAQALTKSAAIEQKMIYTAHVDLTVKNYKRVQAELEQIATKHQAYMVTLNESKTQDRQRADFTYRVPKEKFQAFLKAVQQIEKGTPPRVRIQGQDVTEEMVDLDSRLKAKETMEKRLLDLMKQAKETRDLIEISRQLELVHQEMEQIKGRLQYLNNRVDYSTVHIHMTEYFVTPSTPELPLITQMVESFKNGVTAIGATIEYFLIFLAGAIPVLFAFGLVGIPVWYGYKKLKAKERKPLE